MLIVVTIFSVTIVLARIAAGLIRLYTDKTEGFPSTAIFTNIISAIIILIGILTALGVGGLAVALALQPTLSNLFSGLQIILSRQVRVGDYVRLDSGEGGM